MLDTAAKHDIGIAASDSHDTSPEPAKSGPALLVYLLAGNLERQVSEKARNFAAEGEILKNRVGCAYYGLIDYFLVKLIPLDQLFPQERQHLIHSPSIQ
jgi:hypothetical protein